jgi:hypothetical protein
MQRVRVGMTGLASVVVLIALASAVFNSASTEPAVSAIGSAKPETVANLTSSGNSQAQDEPLAELGVAPRTDSDQNVAGASSRR